MLAQHGDERPSGESLNLWFAYTKDVLAGNAGQDCLQLLTDEELTRSQAFRFERDRCTYLATRLLVRNALSHYHPIPPKAWQFRTNQYGKPAVHPESGLRFNLSHSTELVVCLIGRGSELGIDVEPLSRGPEVANLTLEFFSPQELAQFELLPDQEKLDRALSLWTLKESYAKARGFGLSLPLQKVFFLFDGSNGFQLNLDTSLNDDSSNWRFYLLNLANHRVAIAVETRNQPKLQIWEARPVIAPLIRQIADENTCLDQFGVAEQTVAFR
jgi:4'-phosphopantetheinyl transferase